MYITQETDYAVRIMHCLALANGRRDARSISEEVCVTLRFALKILGKLSANGLVNSYKGNRGGYELAKQPAEISIYDIIVVTEGEFILSRCIGSTDACNRDATGYCVFHRGFLKISSTVNILLKEMTLDKALKGDFFVGKSIKQLLDEKL